MIEAQRRSHGRKGASTSLLAGKLFDSEGNRISPSHTKKGNRRYRYYVSQRVMYGEKSKTIARWPAKALEEFLSKAIRDRLSGTGSPIRDSMRFSQIDQVSDPLSKGALLEMISSVVLSDSTCEMTLNQKDLASQFALVSEPNLTWSVSLEISSCQHGRKQIRPPHDAVEPNPAIINAFVNAFIWRQHVLAGMRISEIAQAHNTDPRHVKRILNLNYLCPELKRDILDGRSASYPTVESLIERTKSI